MNRVSTIGAGNVTCGQGRALPGSAQLPVCGADKVAGHLPAAVGLLLQGQGFLPVRVLIVAAEALVNPARRGSGRLPDVLASQELPWLSRWQRLQGGLPFGQRDGVLQAAGGGVPAPGMVAGVQLCQPRLRVLLPVVMGAIEEGVGHGGLSVDVCAGRGRLATAWRRPVAGRAPACHRVSLSGALTVRRTGRLGIAGC